MAEYEVEGRPYFQILHTLIRHDDDEVAMAQLSRVMEWVQGHESQMRQVFSRDEWGVICHIYDYWADHGRKTTPSRDALEQMIRMKEQPKALLDILEQYDHHEEDLTVIAHDDLHVYFDLRVRDYEKFRLAKALSIASQINVGSYQMNNKEKTVLTGPRDAMTFMIGSFQQGILVDQTPVRGGSLADTTDEIQGEYDIRKKEAGQNNLFIKTGLGVIDNHLGGLRRKELNGILGYSGQRKSGVARTIGYFAARNGFRVLHLPFESDYKEEQDIYAIFHAAYNFQGQHQITKKRLDAGTLSRAEEDLFFKKIVPQYKERIARNLRVYEPGLARSWQEVKAIIERENYIKPIDLCIIDYLTLLRTPGARDDIEDKIRIIQDAKSLAMNCNEGKGLSMLTPVQGSRTGYEEATAQEGRWEKTGIYKYSEMEKTLDNCFYTYLNDQMSRDGLIKFGSCKTRRDLDIPVTQVPIELSGLVGRSSSAPVKIPLEKAERAMQGLDPSAREVDDLGEPD